MMAKLVAGLLALSELALINAVDKEQSIEELMTSMKGMPGMEGIKMFTVCLTQRTQRPPIACKRPCLRKLLFLLRSVDTLVAQADDLKNMDDPAKMAVRFCCVRLDGLPARLATCPQRLARSSIAMVACVRRGCSATVQRSPRSKRAHSTAAASSTSTRSMASPTR